MRNEIFEGAKVWAHLFICNIFPERALFEQVTNIRVLHPGSRSQKILVKLSDTEHFIEDCEVIPNWQRRFLRMITVGDVIRVFAFGWTFGHSRSRRSGDPQDSNFILNIEGVSVLMGGTYEPALLGKPLNINSLRL